METKVFQLHLSITDKCKRCHNKGFYSGFGSEKKYNKNGGEKMKVIDTIALVLIIIGAINWGLIGLFNFNLVDTIFGTMSIISRVIYSLVGISGLWGIKLLFNHE